MSSQILKNCYVLIVASMIASLTGCAAFQNCKYELHQRAFTTMAWSDFDANKKFRVVSSHTADFKRGWKAGFYSVITGGECRPPVVPPKKYWEPPLLFSCNECGCKEWYAGFKCGANVARHQPDYHYIKPWFSAPCPSSEPCQIDSCESVEPHPIRLLGIEPIASPGIEFTDSIELHDTPNKDAAAAEKSRMSAEESADTPADSSTDSERKLKPPKAQPTTEDVPPPPKPTFGNRKLTPRPLPPSVRGMEK